MQSLYLVPHLPDDYCRLINFRLDFHPHLFNTQVNNAHLLDLLQLQRNLVTYAILE